MHSLVGFTGNQMDRQFDGFAAELSTVFYDWYEPIPMGGPLARLPQIELFASRTFLGRMGETLSSPPSPPYP